MSGHDKFTNEPIGLTKEQTRNKEVNQGKKTFSLSKECLSYYLPSYSNV